MSKTQGGAETVWVGTGESWTRNSTSIGTALYKTTDGGVYQSFDKGNSFRFVPSLPVSQFYEVGYDMEWPYNVYGERQDNGTWMAPSRATGGISNGQWRNIGFGDGFHAYPDPADSDVVYAEYQGGQILRF